MKKIKFILLFILSIIFMPNVKADITNINGILISSEEYNNLLNLGYDDDEINNMSLDIFEKNKDIKSELSAKVAKYYKTIYKIKNNPSETMTQSLNNISATTIEISKEEYEAVDDNLISEEIISPLGDETTTNSYQKMVTTMSYISSLKQYKVKNVLTWKKMPVNRSYDIIGMANNSAVSEPVNNTYEGYTKYSRKDSCTEETINYTSTHSSGWKKTSTGAGVTFKLPDTTIYKKYSWNDLLGSPKYVCTNKKYKTGAIGTYNASLTTTSISTTISYNLSKVSGAALNVYGGYKHAIKVISSPSFSIGFGNGATIGVSASIENKFDSMDDTHIRIENPKW